MCLVILRCVLTLLCCLAGGTSLGSSRTFALIEEYCSERLWHASAPHDCISPPSWPPPLDLLGHTDGTVYVSVGGVYCLCVRVRVRAHKTPSPFTALLRAAASWWFSHKHPSSEHTHSSTITSVNTELLAFSLFHLRHALIKYLIPSPYFGSSALCPSVPFPLCFLPFSNYCFTISKLEALYQQLVSWLVAHV